jgi:hypothetical protein
MPITALYAGLLAFLFVALAAQVIVFRRGERISLGDGGNDTLLKRIRAHGNFAEYAPFALVLIGLAESAKADPRLLHGLGIALVAGRIAHAVGVSQSPQIMRLRVGGMIATLTVIMIAAITCLLATTMGGALR